MASARLTIAALALALASALAAAAPRARDLGVPFEGAPGPLNAITDVSGVTVGQVTLIEDLAGGKKVRTGVTAILPRGRASTSTPVFSGWFSLNGNGEMTGTTWIDESGQLEGPVVITNTHSVGVARDAVISWRVKQGAADVSGYWWSLPVVAETWDGTLNDVNGFHVHPEHVWRALSEASTGPVAEGNVGGGTGMICHEFKCGIGTASRRISENGKPYVVGALVQANYGVRESLRIAGVPVGQNIPKDTADIGRKPGTVEMGSSIVGRKPAAAEMGSIIVVVATDAPLLPTQLKRIAKRAGMGLARMGSTAGNGSGDIFVAFSTANGAAFSSTTEAKAQYIVNDRMDALFAATVQATEEAIVNAMVAARDMQGTEGHVAKALPHDQLIALLKRYGRFTGKAP